MAHMETQIGKKHILPTQAIELEENVDWFQERCVDDSLSSSNWQGEQKRLRVINAPNGGRAAGH